MHRFLPCTVTVVALLGGRVTTVGVVPLRDGVAASYSVAW